ncbi:MAG: hypothetical protein JNN11_00935 [Candidatus Doudnabacteria bacterium]|nr:hypothetical protein [Candidatus Doudnabacteria bacterium]
MKSFTKKQTFFQSGQTLIETLVAIFILVMGIVAALGLAIYALNASSNVTKQIIAIGLTREGVEAVKNMRDTNWLKLSLDTDCYEYVSGSNTAKCYKNWLDNGGNWNNNGNDRGYRMDPGGVPTSYRLGLDNSSSNKIWTLNSAGSNWGLDNGLAISNSSFQGLYVPNTSQPNGTSEFYRKITLTKQNSTGPYRDNLERLLVTTQVWWTDKKCPRSVDWPGLGKCSIQLQTYLTNWKNY